MTSVAIGWNTNAPTKTGWLNACLKWLVILAVVRVGMVLTLAALTHHQQFTDDWRFMLSFYEYPMQILLGEHRGGPAFWPPFYPLASALFGRPLSGVLSPFYSVRLVSVIIELLAWPLIWAIITRLIENPRMRSSVALGYICMPIAWVAIAIYGQDESLAMLVLAGVVLLALDRRYRLSALLCGIGAITAKIYFLVPLLAIVIAVPVVRWREYVHRALLGGLPIILGYGWVAYVQLSTATAQVPNGTTGVALLDFKSSSTHGVSLWAIILKYTDLSVDTARLISFVCALSLPLLLLAVVKLKHVRLEQRGIVQLITVMLLIVFLWFYHCDPEYYIMVAPLLWVSLSQTAAFWLGFIGLCAPWAANLGFGVARAEMQGGTGGKALFVNLYHHYIPIPPDILHTLALAALVTVNCTIVVLLIRSMLHADRLWSAGKDTDNDAAMLISKPGCAQNTIAGEQTNSA
jgi:hypothetical protein